MRRASTPKATSGHGRPGACGCGGKRAQPRRRARYRAAHRQHLGAGKRLDCGTLTLIDIVNELKKPGRDPRDDAPEVVFSRSALSIDDLEPGMELKGTVRNVVDFGAFVDVGVHQDGLVHISKLANRFVKHPSDVVRVGDTVKVWVEKVDRDRKKISLTMVQGK